MILIGHECNTKIQNMCLIVVCATCTEASKFEAIEMNSLHEAIKGVLLLIHRKTIELSLNAYHLSMHTIPTIQNMPFLHMLMWKICRKKGKLLN